MGLATPAFSYTLEELIDGKTTVQDLLLVNMSVSELVDNFKNRHDMKNGKIYAYLKQNRKKTDQLLADYQLALRAFKRAPPQSNKYFFGDPVKAENAKQDQILFYEDVKKQLFLLLNEKKINQSTYDYSFEVIDALQYFHVNNRLICLELSLKTVSEKYGEHRPSLHADDSSKIGVEFQEKARNLFHILKLVFNFAEEQGLLVEFYTDGLSKNNGCLEARFAALDRWYEKVKKQIERQVHLSPKSKAKTLIKTAKEAVFEYIEKNYDDVNEQYFSNSESVKKLIDRLVTEFHGKVGCDNNSISEEIVRISLQEVFISSPEI